MGGVHVSRTKSKTRNDTFAEIPGKFQALKVDESQKQANSAYKD